MAVQEAMGVYLIERDTVALVEQARANILYLSLGVIQPQDQTLGHQVKMEEMGTEPLVVMEGVEETMVAEVVDVEMVILKKEQIPEALVPLQL